MLHANTSAAAKRIFACAKLTPVISKNMLKLLPESQTCFQLIA